MKIPYEMNLPARPLPRKRGSHDARIGLPTEAGGVIHRLVALAATRGIRPAKADAPMALLAFPRRKRIGRLTDRVADRLADHRLVREAREGWHDLPSRADLQIPPSPSRSRAPCLL